ncbi:hypothetical protein AXX17_ATUG00770 [Arabidopsis thaliana]|uniref:Uncharacterized protein n=1 Tax=Arabidopsis thaliana TaxID=3702 RepID=A0A178U725_ARATH|nr:hypothetical protein AXX17_ATUG00770 [Arabidopsis thaliana]
MGRLLKGEVLGSRNVKRNNNLHGGPEGPTERGKLEAVSGDLGVDVSEIAANNSSTLGLEAVAVKTRDLFSDYLNQLMVQDYTLAEENSLSFLDTIMEDKEDTFQITDPSQQSNEEVSQEEVMVNEETKEVDKMEEETQTNGEDNGTEIQAGQ